MFYLVLIRLLYKATPRFASIDYKAAETQALPHEGALALVINIGIVNAVTIIKIMIHM